MTLGLVLLAVAGPAAAVTPAWSYEGHRLVCEIAWRELTPTTRMAVTALLATDPERPSFADACVWADLVRDSAYMRYRTAHYVNIPPGAAGVDTTRDCAETFCVVEAIPALARVVGDRQAATPDRLVALKFLIHFVADLHQPLHAGYARDRGGNSTRVVFLGDSTNLHWVWDGALLTALGLGPHAAERLHATIGPVDRHLWRDADPARWADESFQLVEHQVYDRVGDGPLDARYIERNRHTVERQLLKAGVRLGALLNGLLEA